MVTLGMVAFSLSFTSLFIASFASVLTVLSGFIAIMVTGRGFLMAASAIMLNFLHILWHSGSSFSKDWLMLYTGIGLQSLFSLLLIIQTCCLCILIWKWAFHFPENKHSRL